MSTAQSLLPELDHEMASTRRMLERLPDAKLAWKPHPKSMSLGQLATHLAEIPVWLDSMLGADSFDVAPPGTRLHHAEARRPALHVLQPFGPPPRPVERLLAPVRRAAAPDLRAHSRRGLMEKG